MNNYERRQYIEVLIKDNEKEVFDGVLKLEESIYRNKVYSKSGDAVVELRKFFSGFNRDTKNEITKVEGYFNISPDNWSATNMMLQGYTKGDDNVFIVECNLESGIADKSELFVNDEKSQDINIEMNKVDLTDLDYKESIKDFMEYANAVFTKKDMHELQIERHKKTFEKFSNFKATSYISKANLSFSPIEKEDDELSVNF